MIGSGLTLVTGATGSGKTLWVVGELSATEGRPFFCHGIPELTIEHEVAPPVDRWTVMRDVEGVRMPYYDFPAGAVLVVDEAQRMFRPRPVGSRVPDHVSALETRRHTGLDVVLVTQHPGLLDSNVRKLVNRHVHIHCTAFGRWRLEWVGCGDPESSTSRGLAVRTRHSLNKADFGRFKSAEVHTRPVVKRSLLFYIFPMVILLFLVLGWRVYDKVWSGVAGESREFAAGVSSASARGSASSPGVAGGGDRKAGVTVAEYVQSYQERVPGMPHSAPRYDGITQPVAAPYPVGCIRSSEKCRCYDQRGGLYPVDESRCIVMMQRPVFVDFIGDDTREGGSGVRKASGTGVQAPAS